MKKIIAIALVSAVFVPFLASAAQNIVSPESGTGAVLGQQKGKKANLKASVGMNSRSYGYGDTMEVSFVVHNKSKVSQTLTFPTSCKFSYKIYSVSTGVMVFDSQEGLMCSHIWSRSEITAGGKLLLKQNLAITPGRLSEGRYFISANMTAGDISLEAGTGIFTVGK